MSKPANLLQHLSDHGLESLGRHYSSYRGVVIDNVDPDDMNRVRIVVPSLDSELALWAYPKNQDGSMQSGFKWLTPQPGQIVWVEFEFGDILYPLWSYHGFAKNEMPDELKDLDVLGFVTPHGHSFTLNDKTGELSISIKQNDKPDKETINLNIKDSVIKANIVESDKVKTTFEISKDGIILCEDGEGTVKLSELKDNLDKLKEAVNQLETFVSTAMKAIVPPTFGVAGSTALDAAWKAYYSTVTLKDMENTKVKQNKT